MKKLGLLALLSMSALNADIDDKPMPPSDNKTAQENKDYSRVGQEDKQDDFPEKPEKQYVENSESDSYGVFVSGSFLYWITKVDGLNYKLTGAQNIEGFGPENQGATFGPNFQWDPGYRIGLGYENQLWDMDLVYTRYTTSASDAQAFADTSFASPNPSWTVFAPLGGASSAFEEGNVHWNFSYWTVELMSGIFLKANENFKVRPNLGFMSAMLNQNYSVEYNFNTAEIPKLDKYRMNPTC